MAAALLLSAAVIMFILFGQQHAAALPHDQQLSGLNPLTTDAIPAFGHDLSHDRTAGTDGGRDAHTAATKGNGSTGRLEGTANATRYMYALNTTGNVAANVSKVSGSQHPAVDPPAPSVPAPEQDPPPRPRPPPPNKCVKIVFGAFSMGYVGTEGPVSKLATQNYEKAYQLRAKHRAIWRLAAQDPESHLCDPSQGFDCCGVYPVFVLGLIPTNETCTRMETEAGWPPAANGLSCPLMMNQSIVSHVTAQLHAENETHHDLVILNIVESINRGKIGYWLIRAAELFPRADWILKVII